MAGNYADVPGYRFAYDDDGTVGLYSQTTWTTAPTTLGAGTVTALNADIPSPAISQGSVVSVGLIFPEPRNIVGIWKATSGSTDLATETSVNTTNGLDGTWVNRGSINMSATVTSMRTSISSVNWTGIVGIRWGLQNVGGGGYTIYPCHLYGSIPTTNSPDRLLITDTSSVEIAAQLDFADIPRNGVTTKQFKVTNNSASLTANNITVSLGTLSDASPTLIGQFQLSTDNTTFTNSINIGSLAPGATSSTLYIRDTVSSTAQLSLWTVRIAAAAASWS